LHHQYSRRLSPARSPRLFTHQFRYHIVEGGFGSGNLSDHQPRTAHNGHDSATTAHNGAPAAAAARPGGDQSFGVAGSTW
jgi:hypothetical protein